MASISPSLRLTKLWLSIGWSLVIAVIVLSLIPPPPPDDYSLLGLPFQLPHGDKVGHIVTYFILMGWFIQIYHTPQRRWHYMIGFLFLGIFLEILQGLGGTRTADWRDVIANSVGILIAWQLAKTSFAHILVYLESKYLRL